LAHVTDQVPCLVELGLGAVFVEDAMEEYSGLRLAIELLDATHLGEQPNDLGAVVGRLIGALFTQQVVQLGSDVLLDTRKVIVVPGTLQGHEMLLGTTKETFTVKPLWIADRAGCHAAGGGAWHVERYRCVMLLALHDIVTCPCHGSPAPSQEAEQQERQASHQ